MLERLACEPAYLQKLMTSPKMHVTQQPFASPTAKRLERRKGGV